LHHRFWVLRLFPWFIVVEDGLLDFLVDSVLLRAIVKGLLVPPAAPPIALGGSRPVKGTSRPWL